MTPDFFLKMGITWWWLAYAKVAPLKYSILTKRFLVGLLFINSSNNSVSPYNGGTSRPRIFYFIKGRVIHCPIFMRNFPSCYLKWSSCWRFYYLYSAIYSLIFGGANGNLSTATLREKCPNTEFFVVHIYLYSD